MYGIIGYGGYAVYILISTWFGALGNTLAMAEVVMMPEQVWKVW